MKLEGLMARFVLAADPADAVRLFAQHAELRDQRLRVFLQTHLAKARAENNQDADVLLTNRAALLARLQKALGETPGAPDEQGLQSHPLVQEFFERQAKAAALHEEIASLLKYARAAQVRFDRSRDPADLREAVDYLEKLIAHDDFAGTPADFKVEVLDNSASLALSSFVATNERKDLDHAMARFEALLSLLPKGSDKHATRALEASLALLDACQEGRRADLDAVSEWQRQMLEPAGSGPFAEALKAFGDRSRKLFTRSEALTFLEKAVETHREALRIITAEHPERSEYLDTFAIDCKALFDVTSKPEWLDEAIPAWEESVDIGERTPTIPRDYVADYASNLGAALIARFERTGDIDDLSKAAERIERALHLVAPTYAHFATMLSNAGAARLLLFERTGDNRQLEMAASHKQRALAGVETGSSAWKDLSLQVAALLTSLYNRSGDVTLVDQAVDLLAQATAVRTLTPSETHRVNLQYAHALRLRYQAGGSHGDFDRAAEVLVLAHERAGFLRERVQPVLTELAQLLQQKYHTTGDVSALEQATSLLAKLNDANVPAPPTEPASEAFRAPRSGTVPPPNPGPQDAQLGEDSPALPSATFGKNSAPPSPGPDAATLPGPGMTAAVLSAEGPRELAVGKTSVIQVRIEGASGATPLAHRIDAHVNPSQPVMVVVTVRGHSLVLLNPWVAVVALPPSGRAVTCQFRIQGNANGDADIAVQFLQGDSPLGSLTFSIAVTTGDAAHDAQHASTPMLLPAKTEDGTLVLLIQELKAADRVYFKYLVTSATLGVHFQEYDSPHFQTRDDGSGSAPLVYVRSIYRQVAEGALLNQHDLRTFERELQGIGADLCRQLFPPELVRLLWDRRADIQVVQVVSFEPYIPWELVRLTHPDKIGAAAIDARFLAEYHLVRTLHGKTPPNRLGTADWRYLVADFPHGSYERAEGELQYFKSRLPTLGVTAIEVAPQPNALLDLLAGGSFDVLHVAGHAETAVEQIEEAALILGDRRTPDGIRPVTVKPGTVQGVADLTERRPLIFLNACETGRQGPRLTDLGGWPQAFIRSGAGAYVGTSWAVRERPAIAFAQAFYGSLLEGHTLAEAAGDARVEAKKFGDASWLAFTVYGSPTARFAVPEAV